MLVWSERALADLERFAAFLQQHHPTLANRIGPEIARRARLIAAYPELGRPISERYRELSLPVLKGAYVFRYSIGRDHITMLRVFHSRERRDP